MPVDMATAKMSGISLFRHLRSSVSSASYSSGEMIRRRRRSPRRARVKAGMPHVNFHDLRHSCASIMLGLGLGLAISAVLVFVVNPQSFHWSMDLALPMARLAALLAATLHRRNPP